MEEIIKHINDTNASYRHIGAGDAKNTDLFLDNEHYELFQDQGEQIIVRFNKTNLTQAILFIASILPRKFDQSANHYIVNYTNEFVIDQLAILDAFFKEEGVPVNTITQIWNARKNVIKKNGEIDNRFYFNNLLKDVEYRDHNGEIQTTKFTIRNYLAGGFSNLSIKKAKDGIYDIIIKNVTEPYDDGKEDGLEDALIHMNQPNKEFSRQIIYFGAPGTGKSFEIDSKTDDENSVRTTFHPDSDYASFVGAYKPTMEDVPILAIVGKEVHAAVPQGNHTGKEKKIVYKYVPQAFLKAYVAAWSDLSTPQYLVIEEINRGNCAQIFGDLFQLLDRNNSGASSYPIHADEDIKQFLKDDKKGFAGLSDEQRQAIADYVLVKDNGDERHIGQQILDGELLLLPPNLRIWATMNTSDQSLFPIDSAFKRRWDWKYIPISYNPKDKKTDQEIKWKFNVGESLYSWGEFLSKINPEIYTLTESSDKQMGYFFVKPMRAKHDNFAKANPGSGIISEDVFLNKVLFYLWTEVLKDYTTGQEIFINPETKKTFVFTDFFDEKQNALENFIANLKLEEVEDYEPEEDSENPTWAKFIVNGTKTRAITKALCMILRDAAKSRTYSEILDEVTSTIKRSEPIIKKVDNPEEYQKENGWKNMIIKTSDDVSFVVTNQWKKEMVPMILELAEKLGVEVEYNSDSIENTFQPSSGLSSTKKWYVELLTEVRNRFADIGYKFQSVVNNYIAMATGVPGMELVNRVNKRGASRVELWIQPSRATEIFDILSAHKTEIENQFGSSLTWIESAESEGGNKHAEISFIKDGIDYNNPEEYSATIDWLFENGVKLLDVVKPYFAEIK